MLIVYFWRRWCVTAWDRLLSLDFFYHDHMPDTVIIVDSNNYIQCCVKKIIVWQSKHASAQMCTAT